MEKYLYDALKNADKVTRLLIGSRAFEEFPCSLSRFKIENGVEVETSKYKFKLEPRISISGENNIVTKTIINKDNNKKTLKEYIGRGDYTIELSGYIAGTEGESYLDTITSNETIKSLLPRLGEELPTYPTNEIIGLTEILTYGETLKLTYSIANIIGVIKVVCQRYSFPYTQGQNLQQYNITLLSDDYQ